MIHFYDKKTQIQPYSYKKLETPRKARRQQLYSKSTIVEDILIESETYILNIPDIKSRPEGQKASAACRTVFVSAHRISR